MWYLYFSKRCIIITIILGFECKNFDILINLYIFLLCCCKWSRKPISCPLFLGCCRQLLLLSFLRFPIGPSFQTHLGGPYLLYICGELWQIMVYLIISECLLNHNLLIYVIPPVFIFLLYFNIFNFCRILQFTLWLNPWCSCSFMLFIWSLLLLDQFPHWYESVVVLVQKHLRRCTWWYRKWCLAAIRGWFKFIASSAILTFILILTPIVCTGQWLSWAI